MAVIALSGKAKVGKSTIAGALASITRMKRISFGDAVKKEVAAEYGVPIFNCYTQEGKLKTFNVMFNGVRRPIVLRRLLQLHGKMRRQEDPEYWVKATFNEMSLAQNSYVIDDVRDLVEVMAVRSLRGNYIARIHPHAGWVAGEYADDISETALDDYKGFDLELTPSYMPDSIELAEEIDGVSARIVKEYLLSNAICREASELEVAA